jgi:hypothetical protein
MRHSLIPLPLLLCVALAPAVAAADPLDLHGEGMDLVMKVTTDAPTTAPNALVAPSPVVSSQADLTTQVSTLQTRIQVGLQTGSAAAAVSTGSGWWNSGSVNLGATWAPLSLAKIEVSAQNSLRLQFDPADAAFIDAAQSYSQTRQTGATAAATFTPLAPLNLKVGATTSSTQTQSVTSGAGTGAAATDLLQTESRQMFTQVQLKLLSAVSLDGGGKLESTGVYWSGARAGSYAALDPSIGATVKPWDGASWRFSLERAAAPLDPNQFVGYAPVGAAPTTGTPAELAALQPNREWRYKAALEQKAGDIDLTASILAAHLQTYAYVAPYGLAPGRIDSGSGDRSEVQAGLAAPLPLFGLSPFTIKASAAWRASQAEDPVSGVVGRLSGESPYDASLTLSQALWGTAMRWGMTAQATGPARTYLTTQTTQLSATAGVGGFLEYNPGPMTLQLQLANLLGGERDQHDIYYIGPRDLSAVDRMDDLRTVDRTIRISLIRPL